MFKRENRLILGTKFNNFRSASTPQFNLKVKKNGMGINRFGIVVSKKVDKRAVVRNKIKRLFREALIELNRNMFTGNDILLIIKKEIISKTKKEELILLENSLEKLAIIKR